MQNDPQVRLRDHCRQRRKMFSPSTVSRLIRVACILLLVLGPHGHLPDLPTAARHEAVFVEASGAHAPLVQSRALQVVARLVVDTDAPDGTDTPLLPLPVQARWDGSDDRATVSPAQAARCAGEPNKGFWACAPPHTA